MPVLQTQVVTFSGIDGAGKSSQVEQLVARLQELGLRVILCTFWDDVTVFSRFRESVSHRVFKGDKGVGSPEKPISRRDKNVTAWHTIGARLFFYLLDALNLRLVLNRRARSGADFIVFDRYIYDELANLPLNFRPVCLYAKALVKLSPKPDLACLVDADPEAACARKPEYPLEFVHKNRTAYITLSRLIDGVKVFAPRSIEETSAEIMAWISRYCLSTHPPSTPCNPPRPTAPVPAEEARTNG